MRDALPWFLRMIHNLWGYFFFASPEVGAYNSVFAAASPAIKEKAQLYKGAYISPIGKITKPLKRSNDPELAIDLRNTTEKILKDLGVI